MEHWKLTLDDDGVELLAGAVLLAQMTRERQAREATDPDLKRDYGADAERLRRFYHERIIPLRETVLQVRAAR